MVSIESIEKGVDEWAQRKIVSVIFKVKFQFPRFERGLVEVRFERFNEATTQRRNDATTQRRDDATTRRRNDATTQRRNDTTTQRRNDATTQRRDDATTHRRNDATLKRNRSDKKSLRRVDSFQSFSSTKTWLTTNWSPSSSPSCHWSDPRPIDCRKVGRPARTVS